MQWKLILIICLPVIILGSVIGISIFSDYQSEGISTDSFSVTSFAGESNASMTYTPTSETYCIPLENNRKRCYTKQYSYTVYEGSNGKTINDITTMTWLGNSFNFSHISGSYWVEIEPFIIWNGTYMNFQDIKNQYSSIHFNEFIINPRFSKKWGLDIVGLQYYPQFVSNVDNLGFRLQRAGGLTWDDVERRGASIIIKDKYEISFEDLKDVGYTLELVNKTYLLIGNLSAGYDNGKFSLDPTVTLNYGNFTTWSDTQTGSRGSIKKGFHVTLQLGDIPMGADITNATLWLNDPCTTFCLGAPDDDANVSLYNTNGTVFGNWNNWHDKMINRTYPTWINETGGNIFPQGGWWGINITEQMEQRVGNMIDNMSIRITDPDWDFLNTTSSEVKDTRLGFGGGLSSIMDFRSPQDTNTSLRPYVVVVYTAESDPPTVNLLYPTNDQWLNASAPSSGSQFNFSANVTDASDLDYAELWSDYANGTWQLEYTWSTDYSPFHYYNVTYNLSYWFDGGNILTDNLIGSNQRSMTNNGSHWWVSDVQDDITRIYNSSGQNISDFSNPDAWNTDMDTNGTHIVMVDVLGKKLYLLNMSGSSYGSCATTSISSGLPYSVAFAEDNTSVYIGFDTVTPDIIAKAGTDCTNISRYNIPWSASVQSLTRWKDLVIGYDTIAGGGIDKLIVINYTSGTSVFNITSTVTGADSYRYILGLSGDTIKGLWAPPNTDLFEEIYVFPNSPNRHAVLRRYHNSSDITWNVNACDIYTNCAFATSNWTFRITNDTMASACWSYNSVLGRYEVPTGCNCSYGEVLGIFDLSGWSCS